ncbi:hypothetical protein, partial [Cumulibacter manganitolerans]|uniref:hypothetical protein n=1 Tax=Cumulibacter manganitolerans TaxID=1884992 RepID=UPI001E607BEC
MTTAPISLARAPRHEPQAYAAPQPQRHLRLVEAPQLTIDDIMAQHADARSQADPLFRPVPAGEADLPAAETFTRSFFTALSEVIVGRRSADQLARHVALPVLHWVRGRTPRRRDVVSWWSAALRGDRVSTSGSFLSL